MTVSADDKRQAGELPNGSPIELELSQAQVNRVVRTAAGDRVPVCLSELDNTRERLESVLSDLDDKRLSRSLVTGLLVLASCPADGSYLSNAEIAAALEMNESTSHRYISTLVAVGLLERDPGTRHYRQMPYATPLADA